MAGIEDNNPVNANYTNSVLAAKNCPNEFTSVQTLNDPGSGPAINNLQQTINNIMTSSGGIPVPEGSGVPVASPSAGAPPFFIRTDVTPKELYFFGAGVWCLVESNSVTVSGEQEADVTQTGDNFEVEVIRRLLGNFANDTQALTQANINNGSNLGNACLLYTSPSPRDQRGSRMPSSA